MQVEKTVFISYRRTNAMTARAVYQHLTAHGYDCFLDYESIDSGSFERIILNQIAAKAHFVVILTPSALERCAEPGDWLRREIEYALDNGRNIVPLMFDGFKYSDVQKYLTGKLDVLPQYNALEVPSAYFEEAMSRLQNRFLNKPLDVILRPTPNADKQAVAEAKAKIEQMPTVTEQILIAEKWYEHGLKRLREDREGKIADFTEAIRLNPKYVEAHYERAVTRYNKRDYDGAIADNTEAIHLDPTFAEAYNSRGLAHYAKRNYDNAIADYNEAIRLSPKLTGLYVDRGNARDDNNDYDGAIADYDEAIRLDPNNANAYYNRGLARMKKDDINGAIADYSEAIRLNPKNEDSYLNRGFARKKKGDINGAITDYTKAIHLNPKFAKAHNNRAVAYLAKKDYDRAIADYEASLKIRPSDTIEQSLKLARMKKRAKI